MACCSRRCWRARARAEIGGHAPRHVAHASHECRSVLQSAPQRPRAGVACLGRAALPRSRRHFRSRVCSRANGIGRTTARWNSHSAGRHIPERRPLQRRRCRLHDQHHHRRQDDLRPEQLPVPRRGREDRRSACPAEARARVPGSNRIHRHGAADLAESLSRAGRGEAYSRAPVGSGPYRIAKMDRTDEIVLQRYEDYFPDSPKGRPPSPRSISIRTRCPAVTSRTC